MKVELPSTPHGMPSRSKVWIFWAFLLWINLVGLAVGIAVILAGLPMALIGQLHQPQLGMGRMQNLRRPASRQRLGCTPGKSRRRPPGR